MNDVNKQKKIILKKEPTLKKTKLTATKIKTKTYTLSCPFLSPTKASLICSSAISLLFLPPFTRKGVEESTIKSSITRK